MKSRPHSGPWLPLFAALTLMILLGGCGKPPVQETSLMPLAQVGDRVITRERFAERLAARSKSAEQKYASQAGKAELLQEMIDREAIFCRAKAAGFDQQPEVREAIEQLIIDRYRDSEWNLHAAAKAVGEGEIQSYYRDHSEEYRLPAQVRVAMVLVRRPAHAAPEQEAELKARAEAIRAELVASTSTVEFSKIVQARSDDQATKYRGGDLGWFTRNAPPWGLDADALESIFNLQHPGDCTPLVKTDNAFCIFKLMETQPAGLRPIEQVRDRIGFQLAREAQAERESSFYRDMRTGLEIRVNQAELEAVQIPQRTNRPPAMPGAVAQNP